MVYYGGVHTDNFNEFINIVSKNPDLHNATLLIGINYNYSRNLNRQILEDLHPDYCWSEYLGEANNDSSHDQWHQLFFNFHTQVIRLTGESENPLVSTDFSEGVNPIQEAFGYFENPPTLNKFGKIVFDSSTIKLVGIVRSSFLSYLYYYFLEEGGELYFDINLYGQNYIDISDHTSSVIRSKRDTNYKIITEMNESSEIFGKKFIFITYRGIINEEKKEDFNTNKNEKISDIIIRNNIRYFRRTLLHSNVEYYPNEDEIQETLENRTIYNQSTYPIKKTNYPIGPYMKITKQSNVNIDTSNINNFKTIFSAIYKDSMNHKRFAVQPFILRTGIDTIFI